MPFSLRHAVSSRSLRQVAERHAAQLPALLLAAERAAAHVQSGQHRQRKAGSGERFWQYHPYQSHDRPQDIDWRQSAKGDTVYIRQREWQTPQAALFWCAGGAGMDFRSAAALPTKAERAQGICLALALLMTRAGEQIGALGQPQRGRSDAAIERLAQHFLLQPRQESLPGAIGTALPAHAAFILCGDFLSPLADIQQSLAPFSERAGQVTLIQILDPAEWVLPYDGRAYFETPDHRARTHVAHIGSIRDAYQARMTAHCNAIREMCAQSGWHYIRHVTDQPETAPLHRLWLTLSGQEGAM